MDGARPHQIEARANTTTPMAKIFARPNRSPSEPPNSNNAARKSVYDSTTHWTSATLASRLDCNAGNATFTTVPSINTMLEPRMGAAGVQRRCERPQSVFAGLRERIAPSSQGDLSRLIENTSSHKTAANLECAGRALQNKTPPAFADGADVGAGLVPARSSFEDGRAGTSPAPYRKR